MIYIDHNRSKNDLKTLNSKAIDTFEKTTVLIILLSTVGFVDHAR